jgi:hypothetical protein
MRQDRITTPTETAATRSLLGSWPDLEGLMVAAFSRLRPGALLARVPGCCASLEWC